MPRSLSVALCALLVSALAAPAGAVRVKDLASVQGVRENQIIGYGLVVGLNGTGDRDGTEFTVRSLSSLLARLGIGVDPDEIEVKNVAAVMVTSLLPPFAREMIESRQWLTGEEMTELESKVIAQVEEVVARAQTEPTPNPYREPWYALSTKHLSEGTPEVSD